MVFSFPFHAEPLWGKLQEKAHRYAEARANGTDLALREVIQQSLLTSSNSELKSASLLTSTLAEAIIVTSTHIPDPLVLHPEGLRSVMKQLLAAGFPAHCVMYRTSSVPSEYFWDNWEYQNELEVKRSNNDRLYGGPLRSAWAPKRHIPGELTLPLPRASLKPI